MPLPRTPIPQLLTRTSVRADFNTEKDRGKSEFTESGALQRCPRFVKAQMLNVLMEGEEGSQAIG